MIRYIFLALFLIAAPAAEAKQRKVIEELPADIVDNNYVAAVTVTIADSAREKFDKIEEKALAKRAEAGLPPYDPANPSAVQPAADTYDTLPFSAMLPLVMRDVTREWGLDESKGKAVDLKITIETIRTANAAVAMLIGSADELAGLIDVVDPATGANIGSFYVHVLNAHSGWGGMLIRGGGIRERLAEEFALESARVLTGSTKKDWKKRLKEKQKAQKASNVASTD
jgi:uncharacterized coiled-coil protein SlyX